MRSRIVIILFFLVCGYILTNMSRNWHGWVYKYDKSGYHLYLPAVFIFSDLQHYTFYKEIDDTYHPSGESRYYGLKELPNGNRINKYNIGPAIFEAPFFLVAHFINTTYLDYPQNGYSYPYEWATLISNLFWAVVGLFMLRRFLLRYFSDTITALTLLIVAFGTNFYHYAAFSGGMSHNYSFMLFAGVLLHTDNLYTRNRLGSIYWLGLFMGLIGITRSSNLLLALLPLFWGVNSLPRLRERFSFFFKNAGTVIGGLLVFSAVMLLQMGYWKYITGQWFYDSYTDEGFIWTDPVIWKGLFGFQKGWFIYTPLALFAVSGLYSMRRRFKQYIPVIIIFMVLNIYVIFSWWNWWYGGGFGCRPLVEAMAILALPLACYIEWMMNRGKVLKGIMGVLCSSLIFLNVFQSYQSYNTTIHWDHMSRAYYFRVFLKPHASEEDRKYLMPEEEFYEDITIRKEKVTRNK